MSELLSCAEEIGENVCAVRGVGQERISDSSNFDRYQSVGKPRQIVKVHCFSILEIKGVSKTHHSFARSSHDTFRMST